MRKLKATDITNKTLQTPIKIDLLTFNINEEEEGEWVKKSRKEDAKQSE